MKIPELSVFFPLFNEEKNVQNLVAKAYKTFSEYADKLEIILIDDGSTDKTNEIASKLVKEYRNVRLITHKKNKGYGGALKTGFKNSNYEWVFFSDGDLQFDFKDFKKFIKYTKNNDLVIGYRKKRAEGFKRVLIAKLLKIWNKIFFDFPLHIKDIDCAFKLINKKVIKKVGDLHTDGGLISTEFLLKVHRLGFKYKQISVNHYDRKHGSSSGDSYKVIKKAIDETIMLLKILPDRRQFLKILGFWTMLTLILLPVSFLINYMQNDEYTHYLMVQKFMKGDFGLDPYLGATFYTQGFFATLFAIFFGISRIPVLTFLLSTAGGLVFSLLLWKHLKVNYILSVLLGLLLYLNPFYLYSTWGFMTENYFMFFYILSLYAIYRFINKPLLISFVFANTLIVLSYGVRQFGIFTSVSFLLYLLFFLKQKKWFFKQLVLTLALIGFHFFIFPQTPQMYDSRLIFENLKDVDKIFTIVNIIGIYLGVFVFPLVLTSLLKIKKKKFIFVLLMSMVTFFYFEKKFEPENIIFTTRDREGTFNTEQISVQFPYLKNIFTRKGFYEDNLPGDKYTFPGFFDLFNGLNIIGNVTFVLTISLLVFKFKKIDKFSLIYLTVFSGVMVLSPRIFDRYLIVLVPVSIILLSGLFKKVKHMNYLIMPFVLFWLFLGYQFSADNILVNRYVWNKSLEIHNSLGVEKNKINADHSWRQLYPNPSKYREYHFTYKNFGRAAENEEYELIDEFRIRFPLNFYNNPVIYTYKKDLSGLID